MRADGARGAEREGERGRGRREGVLVRVWWARCPRLVRRRCGLDALWCVVVGENLVGWGCWDFELEDEGVGVGDQATTRARTTIETKRIIRRCEGQRDKRVPGRGKKR